MTLRRIFTLVVVMTFLVGAFSTAQAAQHEKKATPSSPEKPATAKTKTAKGTVKSASDDSLVVASVGKDKKDRTFSLDTKTTIKKDGKAVTAKDLKEGDSVTIAYTEADGKMMAKSVKVAAPAKAAAKPSNPCAAKTK
jgi:hypothetical protein